MTCHRMSMHCLIGHERCRVRLVTSSAYAVAFSFAVPVGPGPPFSAKHETGRNARLETRHDARRQARNHARRGARLAASGDSHLSGPGKVRSSLPSCVIGQDDLPWP